MSGQVIHLPRPAAARPEMQRLGLYLHVGHNQHREVLALLAEGVRDFFGIVVDATCADRHKELVSAALARNLDVVLDPQTHRAATVGGYSRRVSDNVAAVAGFKSPSEPLRKNLAEKQKRAGRFRHAMAHLAEANPIKEPALAPKDRTTRERKP